MLWFAPKNIIPMSLRKENDLAQDALILGMHYITSSSFNKTTTTFVRSTTLSLRKVNELTLV